MVGPDRRIVYWDSRAESLMGFLSEEIVGKRCYEVMLGEREGGNPFCTYGCWVVCGGGAILNLLVFWAVTLIGYPHLRREFPELALLVIAFNYALPMAAWMRFRGMAWRPNLEMAGATLGLGKVLIGMAWLGIVSTSTLIALQLSFCGLAYVAMLVVMLFRLDLYTGGV